MIDGNALRLTVLLLSVAGLIQLRHWRRLPAIKAQVGPLAIILVAIGGFYAAVLAHHTGLVKFDPLFLNGWSFFNYLVITGIINVMLFMYGRLNGGKS